jgi:hypothetical protein
MRGAVIIMSVLAICNVGNMTKSWNFDDVASGSLPAGWKVEATGQKKAAAQWQVIKDANAPSSPDVLCLTATNHTQRGVFNLCWTDKVTFLEGEISVSLKANTGSIDQGGGIIWRVQDCNNYYISRYNPLEDNVSIYYVKDGIRVMLGYTGTLEHKVGWHVFSIIQTGNRIDAFLDADLKLRINAGDYITKPGGVGLWTKADAATSFDNFTVMSR